MVQPPTKHWEGLSEGAEEGLAEGLVGKRVSAEGVSVPRGGEGPGEGQLGGSKGSAGFGRRAGGTAGQGRLWGPHLANSSSSVSGISRLGFRRAELNFSLSRSTNSLNSLAQTWQGSESLRQKLGIPGQQGPGHWDTVLSFLL